MLDYNSCTSVSVCQSTISVGVKYLDNTVDVGCSPYIQPQVQLHCCGHYLEPNRIILRIKAKLLINSQPTYPKRRSLHAVVQATVHDVLLTCPGHSSVELFTWSHGDLSSNSPKPSLQTVLDRLEKMVVRFSLVLECQSSITDMV